MEGFLSSAFAETVETVAETAENVAEAAETNVASGGIQIFAIIFFALGLYQIICGIMTMIAKKIYGHSSKNYDQYTEESVKNAMPLIGLQNIFLGIFTFLIGLWDMKVVPEVPLYITGGVVFAITILVAVFMGKKLVKKEEKH